MSLQLNPRSSCIPMQQHRCHVGKCLATLKGKYKIVLPLCQCVQNLYHNKYYTPFNYMYRSYSHHQNIKFLMTQNLKIRCEKKTGNAKLEVLSQVTMAASVMSFFVSHCNYYFDGHLQSPLRQEKTKHRPGNGKGDSRIYVARNSA